MALLPTVRNYGVKIWVDLLQKKKNLPLSPEEVKQYIVGISEKSKILRLEKAFPTLKIENEFTNQIHKNEIFAIDNLMTATPGIEKIFQNQNLTHCIATGATKDMNLRKLQRLGFDKYFNESNCFTADMVDKGKPHPDLFQLAAKSMGSQPQDCIVIEDAVAGFQAAKAANMEVIAFIGAENNNTPEYRQTCKEEKVSSICSTMKILHQTIKQKQTPIRKQHLR